MMPHNCSIHMSIALISNTWPFQWFPKSKCIWKKKKKRNRLNLVTNIYTKLLRKQKPVKKSDSLVLQTKWVTLHELNNKFKKRYKLYDQLYYHLDSSMHKGMLAKYKLGQSKTTLEHKVKRLIYLLSPMKSVDTTSSSVYPKIPLSLPSDSSLRIVISKDLY